MSRFNTGNPLGSGSPLDLDDNAKNMDEAVNSEDPQWIDRFGRPRLPLMEQERQFASDQASREAVFSDFLQESGYQDLGEYAPGIEITAHNQYVTFGGQPYLLKPSIPVPYTTSGQWTGEDFKLIGDDSLRQDLANPDMGAAMVERAVVSVETIEQLLMLPEIFRKKDVQFLVSGSPFFFDGDSFKDRGVISITAFGVKADSDGTPGSGTDNTEALQRMGQYLSGRSNITVTGVPGWVRLVAPVGGTIALLQNCQGIRFEMPGTNFLDDQMYPPGVANRSTLFEVADSKGVTVSHGVVKSKPYAGAADTGNGMRVVFVTGKCEDVEHFGEIQGARNGTLIFRDANTPHDNRSRRVRSVLKCKDVEYPFNAAHSGDDSSFDIVCSGAGRPFFVYGVSGIKGRVETAGQYKSSNLASYGPFPTEDVEVLITDRGEVPYPSSSDEVFELAFHGEGAAIRDVRIKFDVTSPPVFIGHLIGVSKYVGAETIGYDIGASIEDIEFSGKFDRRGATGNILTQVGSSRFSGTELVKNIAFKNFASEDYPTSGGNISFGVFADAQPSGISLENVTGIRRVLGHVPLFARQVQALVLAATDARQTYIDCHIDFAAEQSLANKQLINTEVGGEVTYGRNLSSGFGSAGQDTLLSGGEYPVAAGIAIAVDTGIPVNVGGAKLVSIHFRRGDSIRSAVFLYLYNPIGAAGAKLQHLISSDNAYQAGISNVSLSGSSTLIVTSDYQYAGTLFVNALG